MTITKLQIRNFQCHSKLSVVLDPYCTTFVGASDRGKSSVLRCLRWICTNTPAGTAFIRYGTETCKGRLIVDGHKITRTRGKENKYQLDENEYKAFGTGGVPDSISNLLNLGPVNWQGQHDPAYWLSDTAGQVSKSLNAVVNLDVIDDALAISASRVRKSKMVSELAEERETEAEQEVKDTEWAKEAEKDLKRVDKAYHVHVDLASKSASLGVAVEQVKLYESVHKKASAACSDAQKVVKAAKTLLDSAIAYDCLVSIVDSIKELDRKRTKEEYLASLKVVKAGKSLRILEKQHKGLASVVSQVKKLGKIEIPNTKKLDEASIILCEAVDRFEKFEALVEKVKDWEYRQDKRFKMFGEAEKELKEYTKGRCPICNSEMKEI